VIDPKTLALVGVILLIGLAGFFAASEAALLALTRVRILQRPPDEKTHDLMRLHDGRDLYLTTILVGNVIVLLVGDSLATWLAIAAGVVKPVFWATVVMTVSVLIFGEIVPKMVAVQNPTVWGPRLSPFLKTARFVLWPITQFMLFITHWMIRLVGGKPTAKGLYVTEDDIRTLVEVGEKQGVLEEEEKEMIHSIFEMGDTVVREVMTPRTDMVCADVDQPITTAVELVIKEGYSKLPVYEGNIDHIVGVVHDRELLIAVSRGEQEGLLRPLMRPIKAIPENKKIDELMREMQAEKVSVAIVVDEYGGTAGLVTMEDLLEEIVGDIMDEYDAEEADKAPDIVRLPDGEVVVDARMGIDDVNDQLGLELPTEDFESIGGYTFGLFGRVPLPGEQVAIDGGLTLVVEKTAGRRLLSVRIKLPTTPNGSRPGASSREAEHGQR
jgi:CBS domain containing-hemolysin-like protein